jgi:hypothetical protein
MPGIFGKFTGRLLPIMSAKVDSGKVYHVECTGLALETVKQHQSDDADITFFAACFCPFVQRVWTALEFLNIPYKVSFLISSVVHALLNRRYSVLYALSFLCSAAMAKY